MATRIAGTESGVSVTRFARGTNISALGSAYQVTWAKRDGTISHLSFEDEDTAMAFYHLIFASYEIR